jgi:hypothetical protein
MNVFVDTNILLEIYEAKSASASDLDELIKWGNDNTVNLLTTRMAKDEFERNRDRVVSESLMKFKKWDLNLVFPGFVRDDTNYGDVKEAERMLKEKHKNLSDSIVKSIREGTLKADEVVSRYFAKARVLDYDETIVVKANYRDKLGKDPGKPGQLGDHVNWILLQDLAPKDDLTIISSDGDYECKLTEGNIRTVLREEYARNTQKSVVLAKSIKLFLDNYDQHVQTVRSESRRQAVTNLVVSGSFASTHGAIAKLSVFTDFTDENIQMIIDAYETNGQVGGIASDDDVEAFFKGLKKHVVGKNELRELYERTFRSCKYTEIEELPFWQK